MNALRVHNGKVFADGPQETPEGRKGRERVNEVMEKLADVVFNEPPKVGFSAVVSFLAVLLTEMTDPLSEVKDTSAVLEALVRINLTREEAIVLYRI